MVGCKVDKARECALEEETSDVSRGKSRVTLSVYEKKRGIALPYYNLLCLFRSYVFRRIYVANFSHYLNLERFLRADYQVAKIDAKSSEEISLGGNGRSALTNTINFPNKFTNLDIYRSRSDATETRETKNQDKNRKIKLI